MTTDASRNSPLNLKRKAASPELSIKISRPADAVTSQVRKDSLLSVQTNSSRDASPQVSPSNEKLRDDVFDRVPSAFDIVQVMHIRAAQLRAHWLEQRMLEQQRVTSLQLHQQQRQQLDRSKEHSPPAKRSRFRSFAIDDILRSQQDTGW